MFIEVVNYVKDDYLESLRAISLSPDKSDYDKLKKIVTLPFENSFEYCNSCAFPMKMLSGLLKKDNGNLCGLITEMYSECIEVIKKILDNGVSNNIFKNNFDTWTFAMCIVGAMGGVLQQGNLHYKYKSKMECDAQLFFLNIIDSILVK